jgi:hypothetical protein
MHPLNLDGKAETTWVWFNLMQLNSLNFDRDASTHLATITWVASAETILDEVMHKMDHKHS